jgi:ABC-type multidrug transport system fused ATPase/permease subunit
MIFKAIKEAVAVFPGRIRLLVTIAFAVRIVANVLDIAGTILMALLVSFIAAVLSGLEIPVQMVQLLQFFAIEGFTPRDQVLIIGSVTVAIFFLKPALLLPLNFQIARRMQMNGAVVTGEMFQKYMRLPISSVRQWSTPDITYVMNSGMAGVVSILVASVTLAGEVSLLISLSLTLIFVNPWMTLSLALYILLLFGFLTWISGSRMRKAGQVLGENNALLTKNVLESMSAFREISVAGLINRRNKDFLNNRKLVAKSLSTAEFLNQIPRFAVDLALILGIVLVAVFQVGQENLVLAAGTTVLFLTAATRMLPTVGPIQGSLNGIANYVGQVERFYRFKNWLDQQEIVQVKDIEDFKDHSKLDLIFSIESKNLSIKYPNSDSQAVKNITFTSKHGDSLAIVGKSGSGKTTLADAVLGLLIPQTGEVLLGGRTPLQIRNSYPGSMSYVSQDVALLDGTIKENVSLGLPENLIDLAKVEKALRRAHIWDFVQSLPEKLDTVVGERGTRLSGGQRQRIGIARALYSEPLLLVLDEATSALDAETEAAITDMLKELHGEVTVIAIAHRLSTVQHSDLVLFLRDGVLVDQGKFAQLVAKHPDLARQASLLGMDVVE